MNVKCLLTLRRIVLLFPTFFVTFAYAQVNGITVEAPSTLADTVVDSPFYLQAEAPTCNSQAVSNFGYSVDTGSTKSFGANPIWTMVTINDVSGGEHAIHLKAYNGSGGECDYSITVRVGGGVNVIAPTLSATLAGTFNLVASAPTCHAQTTTEMGYNVDGGNVTTAAVTSYNTQVDSQLSSGSHILRVKAFAGSEYCETDIPFSVVGGAVAPVGTHYYADIETLGSYSNATSAYTACPANSVGWGREGANGTLPYVGLWQTQPDCGTNGGKSNYSTTYPVTNETYGLNQASRQLVFTNDTPGGGVRWFNQLPFTSANSASSISAAGHFIYDVYYFLAPGSSVGEIELDLNHAPSANNLFLLGVQCSYGNKWQITKYVNGGSHWEDTVTTCPTSAFSTGVWHHVQVQTEHSSSTITYDTAWIDGVAYSLNNGVTSVPESTGWAQSIGPNFQLDGRAANQTTTAQTTTAYLSNFFVWYW
ncbi:MAG: hypothetical protein M3Y50_11885 [Acidobacteriota bacterium]|nr:hypothetical protein [Acidobacteriota bacterium]